jgi:5'-deoxynucleotidase YfbR-like HD superfamily hydrolase
MNKEEKDDLIEEIISEFRYEIEGLESHEEEQVEEIIENIISEYIDDEELASIVNEITPLLWEEWEVYLDEFDYNSDDELYIDDIDDDNNEYEE